MVGWFPVKRAKLKQKPSSHPENSVATSSALNGSGSLGMSHIALPIHGAKILEVYMGLQDNQAPKRGGFG